MTVWLLTVVASFGEFVHVMPFPTSDLCADAMFEWALDDSLDARCHAVHHDIGGAA